MIYIVNEDVCIWLRGHFIDTDKYQHTVGGHLMIDTYTNFHLREAINDYKISIVSESKYIKDKRCNNCSHYQDLGNHIIGFCKASAPVALVNTKHKEAFAMFPKVSENNWCGNWKGKV